MPLDPEPAEGGTVMVDWDAGVGIVLSQAGVAEVRAAEVEHGPDAHEPLYLSHFATCPQARQWRKR